MNAGYFDALVAACEEDVKTFTKGRYKNFWNSIVDKYSEQAHFVYELLQNTNDAEATYARFILFHDKLIFAHNGKRHFSVSDPETEEMDRENGNLGDVNSITSIAFSTKTDEDTIGKFGVGFKAVFQYTSTPYIYDSDIKFKIERYIIPRLLENDHPERKNNETLFEFPFDHIINNILSIIIIGKGRHMGINGQNPLLLDVLKIYPISLIEKISGFLSYYGVL